MERPFIENEWKWERSSGYAGRRNKFSDEWIYEEDYQSRVSKSKEDTIWEDDVFRIIKNVCLSNAMTENIVQALKKEILVFKRK